MHNKSSVEYITQKSKHLPVRLHPLGAITKNTEGKELAELYDMHASGAVAFTDGWKSIQSGGLLLKALQYVLAIDVPIVQLPDDRSFNPGGLMHEGIVSTQLGLPGRPALAEELMVARDIELVRYTGARLHLTGLSTAGSVERVRNAKAEGLPVTCSVTPLHLLFTEEDLRDYDTNLKLTPPLRTAADRDALRAAVLDGTVDCIASHHLPQDSDHKVVEFEAAAAGALGLQTAFATVCTALPQLESAQLAALFGGNARNIFKLPATTIAEGAQGSFTLFTSQGESTFTRGINKSRSVNSPLFGRPLTGRIAGIIAQGAVFLNTF
ncbi:MAG: dihydroorotase [Chitinophagaceae bacterium]|nr:MAG: dihydroorotase [Chitinophagaceae bacterium]